LEAVGDDAAISSLSECSTHCAFARDLDRLAAVLCFNMLSKYIQVSACVTHK
jgi:hypothetical protein